MDHFLRMPSRIFLFGAVAVLCLQFITAKDIECASTPKPDFTAPGRRISEEKCLEYNWERNNIEKCSKEPAHTDYPYVGMIGFRKENKTYLSFKCGVFLISLKFALTASHCVVHTRYSQFTPEIVRFGNRDINADVPRADVKIKRVIKHPEYKPPKRSNDIALLELVKELPMTKSVQPICLWHSSLDGVGDVFSPGWGLDIPSKGDGVFREIMRVMKLALIDREKCQPLLKNQNRLKVQEHQICVEEPLSEDPSCSGSAGSPLVTVGKLAGTEDQIPYAVGVSSFSLGCGEGIGFYTNVSSFMDWIEQVVWSSS